MKKTMKTLFVCNVLAVSLVGIARAQVEAFFDDFTGPTLDPMWTEFGVGGVLDAANDVYVMTPVRATGSARLRNSNTGDTLSDYTHELTIDIVTFLGPPNTSSEIRWKSFGPDGLAQLVITTASSTNNVRMFHNPSGDDVAPGNIFRETITFSDSQSLTFRQEYRIATDMITVLYSIDDGPEQLLYSGTGLGGALGDIVTGSVEFELIQTNSIPGLIADREVHIDSWSLIPEPDTCAPLIGCFALTAAMMLRRRRF